MKKRFFNLLLYTSVWYFLTAHGLTIINVQYHTHTHTHTYSKPNTNSSTGKATWIPKYKRSKKVLIRTQYYWEAPGSKRKHIRSIYSHTRLTLNYHKDKHWIGILLKVDKLSHPIVCVPTPELKTTHKVLNVLFLMRKVHPMTYGKHWNNYVIINKWFTTFGYISDMILHRSSLNIDLISNNTNTNRLKGVIKCQTTTYYMVYILLLRQSKTGKLGSTTTEINTGIRRPSESNRNKKQY